MSVTVGADRSNRPPGTAAPTDDPGSSAAVASLTTIWPALAIDSISAVTLAPGPLTISSRWMAGSPTRKKWKRPL
jgi:hypothetical protein